MAEEAPEVRAASGHEAGQEAQALPCLLRDTAVDETSGANKEPRLTENTDDSDKSAGVSSAACSAGSIKVAVVLGVSLLILVIFLSVQLDAARPNASRGAAVLLITALWWFTEVLPLTITSLLPMVLYPLLGVATAKELSAKFFTSTSFLFVAGFFIGLAVERWGLHKRTVCTVIAVMGQRMELLLAGFMLSVWLLSMWISNTATILSMLPMARAFLDTLPASHDSFKSSFLLICGYSATIGGIATPVGTPTNGIFMDQFAAFWPDEPEFSFATFFGCALPLSMMLLIVLWLGFCTMHVWCSREPIPVDHELFKAMRAELGKVSFEQMVVAADLLLLIVLWFTASPINNFPGWKNSVAPELSSGAIGLFFTLPLFFIPCGWRLPRWLRRAIGEERCATRAPDPEPHCILDWPAVRGGFKWEILFVFGGGMMIAHGTVKSGLAEWIAEGLAEVGLNEFGFIFLITLIICFITEFISNMSALATFGSIITATAKMKGYDQAQLLLVVTFTASFAFMLPMAGGPNMVVYSTGKVSVRRMALHGFALNLTAILIGSIYTTFLMPFILGSYAHLPMPTVD